MNLKKSDFHALLQLARSISMKVEKNAESLFFQGRFSYVF